MNCFYISAVKKKIKRKEQLSSGRKKLSTFTQVMYFDLLQFWGTLLISIFHYFMLVLHYLTYFLVTLQKKIVDKINIKVEQIVVFKHIWLLSPSINAISSLGISSLNISDDFLYMVWGQKNKIYKCTVYRRIIFSSFLSLYLMFRFILGNFGGALLLGWELLNKTTELCTKLLRFAPPGPAATLKCCLYMAEPYELWKLDTRFQDGGNTTEWKMLTTHTCQNCFHTTCSPSECAALCTMQKQSPENNWVDSTEGTL